MNINDFLADFQRTVRARDIRDANARVTVSTPTVSQTAFEPAATEAPQAADQIDSQDRASFRADYTPVSDSQNVTETQAALEVGQAGLTAARKLVSAIGARLNEAAAMTEGRAAVNDAIDDLKTRLRRTIETASFAGQNWLMLGNGQTPETLSLTTGAADEATGADAQTIEFSTGDFSLVSDENAEDGVLTRPHAPAAQEDGPRYYLLASDGGSGQDDATEISVNDDQSADDIKAMSRAVSAMLAEIAGASGRIGAAVEQLGAGSDPYLQGVASAVAGSLGQNATILADRSRQSLSAQNLSLANGDSMRFSQQFA